MVTTSCFETFVCVVFKRGADFNSDERIPADSVDHAEDLEGAELAVKMREFGREVFDLDDVVTFREQGGH